MNNWNNKKVLVTGGNGFLGHHVIDEIKKKPIKDLFCPTHQDFDLTKDVAVKDCFMDYQPDIVIHLAGLVGGILPNKEQPAEYFYQNLLMGTYCLHYAHLSGAEKFMAAGAGCGYPENAPMPLKESDFWNGFPQKESAPYSLAKRLLTVQAEAYFRQYGFVSLIAIPGNLYGPFDNFNLNDAHVIPALVRKFVEAQIAGKNEVEVWGSGKAARDFVYASDVASCMLSAVDTYSENAIFNISSGVETTVKEVCILLKKITGFNGDIVWLTDKPDGQLRRCFDMSKAKNDLGFTPQIDIKSGLEKTVLWFKENLNNPALRL